MRLSLKRKRKKRRKGKKKKEKTFVPLVSWTKKVHRPFSLSPIPESFRTINQIKICKRSTVNPEKKKRWFQIPVERSVAYSPRIDIERKERERTPGGFDYKL